MKRVLVAMSGGVDSSLAALLLKKSGYAVSGATMCLGLNPASGSRACCSPQAILDAKEVCRKLGINHVLFDFSQALEEKVISNFLQKYNQGKTPNPCVDCNKFIKFGALFEKAKILGFDYLATGHYAKIKEKEGSFFLVKPQDKIKDQTYFLYLIEKEKLASLLFPLADLQKEKVRYLAQKENLPTYSKPQSQDLCFILEEKYTGFIEKRLKKNKEGQVVDKKGKVLGKHKGISFYTVGQRRGLGISSDKPLYVLGIDAANNKIIAGGKEELQKKTFIAGRLNLFVNKLPRRAKAKIRYAHKEADCEIINLREKVKVVFSEKQEAITPGQAVVFYNQDAVLGGGAIEEVLDGDS